MNKTAITAAPIAPVLAERWSPRSYDTTFEITAHDLTSVLEAARWAPSANNGQPWRFSVATRGSDLHAKATAGLSGFNAAWAPSASALIVVSVLKSHADGRAYTSAQYDAGLAVANLTIQAQELGLHTHQMMGFDQAAIHQSLELDENLEVLVIVTVGTVAPAEPLEGPAYEREIQPRVRHALEDIVLHGKP
jgi:nitroreductase